MTKRTVPKCVCDSFYDSSHSECEVSSGYVCKLLENVDKEPSFRSNGTVIEAAEAVSLAGRLLREASYPLITGLENVGVESQKAAANLARVAKGVVDSGWSDSAFSSIGSMTRVGMVSATIGEVALRSDVMVVIEGDPWSTHPRLANQLLGSDLGSDKTLIYLGTKGTMNTSVRWEQTMFVDEGGLETLLVQLEMLLAKLLSKTEHFDSLDDNQNSFVQLLADSRYVTFLANDFCIGPGVAGSFSSAFDSLVTFASRLNRNTRCVVLPFPVEPLNGHGAENVLTWNFGFPRAVDLAQGSAFSFGDEYSTRKIVTRRECDLLLNFGELPLATLDKTTVEFLRSIPILSFTWNDRDAWPMNVAPSTIIEFKELALLPDDFIRFDDASFELKDDNAPDVPFRLHLRDFLDQVSDKAIL